MFKEYSTRSKFLENVAVGNLMKTRLDEMVVIRMKSRQTERNQRKLKAGNMKPIKQFLLLRRKKIILEY